MRTSWIVFGASLAFAATAIAAEFRAPAGVTVVNNMLVNQAGMTLYTWDNDREVNKSACAGMCLMNWPALAANADSGNMGEWVPFTRDDGTRQWAYKGKPLYTYRMDAKAGDTIGDGRGGTWHIARP
jgi:predicted lipoprotein with Yx(FWY)xxD motif